MTTSAIVTEWRGLHAGAYQRASTDRRALDVPRELRNLLVDSYGHLVMPPEGEVLYDLDTAEGNIRKIAACRAPDGLLVHIGNDVWFVPRDTETPRIVATFDNDSLPMWVTAMSDSDGTGEPIVEGRQGLTLFGNPFQTFALRWPDVGSWDDATATDVSDFTSPEVNEEIGPRESMVNGRHSLSYKGRRYVAEAVGAGSRRVWFSELNAPLTFQRPDDLEPLNYFDVGGDDTGGSLGDYIGELRGFATMEDVLVIFLSQSIWLLTGTGPEDFMLRRTQSHVGCISIETVVRTDDGLMFVGALPNGEPGVYLFTGSRSTLVSADIGTFFQGWESTTEKYPPNVVEDEAEDWFNAVRWEDQYVLAAPGLADDRQLYVYDLVHQRWSTWTGWVQPRLGNLYGLVIGDNDHLLRRTEDQMLRAPAAEGDVELGWADDARPGGWVRYLAAKVFARTEPDATATVEVSAQVPDATAPAVAERTLTTEIYDVAIYPIAQRGHALDLALHVEADADTTVWVEGLEVVHSRKGEKLSRL